MLRIPTDSNMPRNTSAYSPFSLVCKSVNHLSWTTSAVRPPQIVPMRTLARFALRAKTFIHPRDTMSINEGCIPANSPQSFLGHREADLQVASNQMAVWFAVSTVCQTPVGHILINCSFGNLIKRLIAIKGFKFHRLDATLSIKSWNRQTSGWIQQSVK